MVQADGTITVFLVVTWDFVTVRRTEVEVRVEDDVTNLEIGEVLGGERYLFSNVRAGTTYEFRARHVDEAGHAGVWSDYATRTISGDLTPPEDLASLVVTGLPGGYRASWDAAVASDYKHTEVRQGRDHVRRCGIRWSRIGH